MVLLLALIHFVFTDVQFTTHLGDALDKPVFKKGAAFVFKYQAVTPESESKVRVFSPFPKIPEINLTDAYTILQTRGHTDLMTGMDTVKLCRTERMGTLYDQLFDPAGGETFLDTKRDQCCTHASESTSRGGLVLFATIYYA